MKLNPRFSIFVDISLMAVLFVAWTCNPANAKEALWIDTDISIGEIGCDVDDGLALYTALKSPEIELLGVSSIFGNAELDTTDRIAREFLKRAGSPLTVARGAASAKPEINSNEAVEAMARTLKTRRVTLLLLGPATNAAALIKKYPAILPNIKQVIAVAGRRPRSNLPPRPKRSQSARSQL